MRIRSIRPEFWTSEDIAALDWDTRLIFIGLWSYVDDNGVGRDVDKLITADLFPLEDDPRETVARVHRALETLSAGSLITRYEVDGKPYLHVRSWAKHQKIDRPGKDRYPLPTCTDAIIRDTLATDSRDPRDTPSTGEGEKGRRGEVLTPSQPAPRARDYTPEFEEFWQLYPRKIEKPDAFKAWKQTLKQTDAQTLIAAVQGYAFPQDRTYIKYPAVWLRKGSWQDGGGGSSNGHSVLEVDNRPEPMTGEQIKAARAAEWERTQQMIARLDAKAGQQ